MAAEAARGRAAIAAASADAAAEDGSSAEDSAAAAGTAPAAKRQDAVRCQEPAWQQEATRQPLARTSGGNVSAEAGVGDGSEQLSGEVAARSGFSWHIPHARLFCQVSSEVTALQKAIFDTAGSRQEHSAEPSLQDSGQPAAEQQRPAKILPAKRKADAVAAAPKLHDGWAKLAKLDAGSLKAPAASASAAAGAAQPLPALPPLRTGSTSKAQQSSALDRKDPRMPGAVSAAGSENGEPALQRAPSDGRGGPLSRLQDHDSLLGERLLLQHAQRRFAAAASEPRLQRCHPAAVALLSMHQRSCTVSTDTPVSC